MVGLFVDLFAQDKLKPFDIQQKTRGNVVDEVSEYSDTTQKLISDLLLLNMYKTKSKKFLRNLFIPSDNEIDILKVRGINNVSLMYKENVKSIVLLVSPDYSSMGAGCVVSEDGNILTNYHVIKDFERLLTFFYNKDITKVEDIDLQNFKIAEVIAVLPEKDLALLKITGNQKTASLRFADNSSIDVGQDVFAIGHPETNIWSFTSGVISQLRNNYEWSYDNRFKCRANVIQTQTPINPGNSGGPLFDVNGNLIGINSFRTKAAEGLNFAVRVDEIEKFLEEVKEGKHSYSAWVSKTKPDVTIVWNRIDSNRNGIIDCELSDIDGDGIYDIGRFDENEDGFIEYIAIDSNRDGIIDIYVYDRDRDGRLEYFVIDTDYDGYLDTVGIDTNGDGTPDKFDDYR